MEDRKNNLREFPARNDRNGAHRPYSFACTDMGYQCDWRADAVSEDELMHKVEEHGRQAHNFQQLSDQKRFKIRNNIQRAA